MFRVVFSACSAALLLSALFAQSASAQDPFKDPAPEGIKAGWGNASIPINSREKFFFGPQGCPVVLVGKKVWEIAGAKERCQLDFEEDSQNTAAISDNGQFIAVGKRNSDEGDKIEVFDTTSGTKLFEIPQYDNPRVYMKISINKYVISNTSSDEQIDVWSIADKKQLKSIKLPDKMKVDHEKLDFSGDGRFFCMAAHEGPVVLNTSTGKVVQNLAMGASAAPKTTGKRGLPNRGPDLQTKLDGIFTTAWMQSLSFSPEGDEIAAYTTHPNPRLLCWGGDGKLKLDIAIPDISRSFDSSFYWLPGKTGWIVNGLLVDRASQRPVMQFIGNPSIAAIDKDHLIGRFGEDANQLEQFTIPWEDIRKATKAMEAKEAAILAPYQPVSIDVKVESARGDAAEFARVVREAVAKRLERGGVTVKDGQPTTIRVTVSEKAGETLAIYEKSSRFDFRGHDTGRTATGAKGSAIVEVVSFGEAEPVWRDKLQASNSTSFDKDINDATVRESMLNHLAGQLNRLNLPYFIPKSEELLALPITVQ